MVVTSYLEGLNTATPWCQNSVQKDQTLQFLIDKTRKSKRTNTYTSAIPTSKNIKEQKLYTLAYEQKKCITKNKNKQHKKTQNQKQK